MADDLGERSEEATPKRRQEARAEGQVAKSQDLSAVLLLTVGTATVAVAAAWMLDQGRRVIAAVLSDETASEPLNPAALTETIGAVAAAGARIAAPVVLVVWVAAFLAHFGQIGWLFAPKVLRPRASKLNPLLGVRRVFGLSSLVKAALDSLKVVAVAIVVVWTIRQRGEEIVVLPYLSMMQCLLRVGWLLIDLAARILAIFLVLGVIDFAYQRWKHTRDLRMTKQQVKDEMKQTEGDPEVKRRRLRMQQQIAMQRISTAVPRADVVVTNPEHISIALQYDEERMNAPKVVAKGADYIALRIRQIAMRHGIPIVERKPLARALYRDVAVGQEIPPAFYTAVAEVLAYVFRLRSTGTVRTVGA